MNSILEIFIPTAWAQDGASQGDPMIMFLWLGGMFVLLYFLMIRPQNKKQKEHRQMVEALGSGDEVVTAGGVLGKVTEVGDQFLTVEIANNVSIKIQRHTIATVLPKGTLKSA
jgi:preprotein translocase subunit YajC